MTLLRDIDVLGDEALQQRITRWSAAVAVAGLALAAVVGALTLPGGSEPAFAPGWWLALVVGVVLPLPVHELVHAAAFKLLAPGCHVSFGAQLGFLYTKTDGVVLPRGRMVVVLLAPTVLVTAATAAVPLWAGCPVLACALAAIHLSGCMGDVLMARAAVAEPGCTHVRDTDRGIELLAA